MHTALYIMSYPLHSITDSINECTICVNNEPTKWQSHIVGCSHYSISKSSYVEQNSKEHQPLQQRPKPWAVGREYVQGYDLIATFTIHVPVLIFIFTTNNIIILPLYIY